MADFIAPRLTDPSRIDGTVSMTSDQEAVCETCGGKGEIRYRAPHRVGEFVYTCRDCKGTGRIPAPSVPSDERCSTCDRREREDCPQCEFDIHREAPGIGACQKHHPFSYPPTPSQDAEGDLVLGAALAELAEAEEWADRLAYAIAPVSVIGEHSSANNPWMNALEIVGQRESAIRAPYEALVRRGRAVLDDQQAEYECGFCSGSNADHEDECVIPPFAAALTSIEESLGGRS